MKPALYILFGALSVLRLHAEQPILFPHSVHVGKVHLKCIDCHISADSGDSATIPGAVSAWVALSEASEKAGCMRVVPGTHTLPMIEHDDKPGPHNMIKRGQGISDRFDNETGVAMPLKAGELSLHHTALVHCSPGNDADDRRMGLGISFIPAHVKPIGGVKPSALLVRGQDRYGNFVPEKRLGTPMSAEAQAAHTEAVRLFRLLQDAGFKKAAE